MGAGPAPSPYGTSNESQGEGNFLEQLRPYTDKIEDMLDTLSEPIKP